jgi:hypothetical protein
MIMTDHDARQMLRHTIATVAYRGRKALAGAPPEFAAFKAGPTTRTPGEILAHVGDLLDWAWHLCQGNHVWQPVAPQDWAADVARFFDGLARLEDYLESDAPLKALPEQVFQGPIADALTHIGQINLLRRLAASPVRGENYFNADIHAGRVGPEQTAPRFEFD